MDFNQFKVVTGLVDGATKYFSLTEDWREKREQILLYSQDIPELRNQLKNEPSHPYELDPKITLVNPIFRLRLASACESAAHCLYAMAEIAAQFANKATKGEFPSSFHQIIKKLETGWNPKSIKSVLSENHWYKKIREMRTEWTHFSTIFIGGDGNDYIIVLKSNRRTSDRVEFIGNYVQIVLNDFLLWLKNAVAVLDSFADYLAVNYLLPNFPPEKEITIPALDKNGFPIFKSDMKIEIEKVTIREYFGRSGIHV